MKTEKEIVLKAAEGITFRVHEEEERIVIEAINKPSSADCSYNYKNPKIPQGYVHLCGTWDTGFVIRNQFEGSEFVWIPVGWLDADATLDGKNFNEKFGRVNWRHNLDFSRSGFNEEVSPEDIESVKKYGGYYFARYLASKEDGMLVFKKGNMPLGNIIYPNAETFAEDYARGRSGKDVVSKITSGAAFDSVLRWIIKSRAKTLDEVAKDSTSWGNYSNTTNSPKNVMPTGSDEKWSVLNIYDIAGNVEEWTSERFKNVGRVLRSSSYSYRGYDRPACYRGSTSQGDISFGKGFRVVLYLK